jgi:hypothetical protein
MPRMDGLTLLEKIRRPATCRWSCSPARTSPPWRCRRSGWGRSIT